MWDTEFESTRDWKENLKHLAIHSRYLLNVSLLWALTVYLQFLLRHVCHNVFAVVWSDSYLRTVW